jgi:hypothetical protein
MKYYLRKRVIRAVISIAIFFFCLSCNVTSWQSILDDSQLTESEVIEGLKTSLDIGTEKAVSMTSRKDGFFRDEAIKILLPEEANNALITLREAPGGEKLYQATISPLVDDLIEALNRSAEDAASKAAPLFKDALSRMTIQEAWDILNGKYKDAGNQSATLYFRDKTFEDLTNLFQPEIKKSLDKPLAGTVSANAIWEKFVRNYETIARSPANILMGLKPLKEPDLSRYVTSRALDGLFIKVADEEAKIRRDPYSYANQILVKVFGKSTG